MNQPTPQNAFPDRELTPLHLPEANPPAPDRDVSAAEPVPILSMSELATPMTTVSRELELATQRAGGSAGPTSTDPLVRGWQEVLEKLFVANNGSKMRLVYDQELQELEESSGQTDLLAQALRELSKSEGILRQGESGAIANPSEVGPAFDALYALVLKKVDVCVAVTNEQLTSASFPLSKSMAQCMRPVVEGGEGVIVMVAKEPPRSAASELQRIADESFGGLLSLWQRRELWDRVGASPALKDYLTHATVRILVTGESQQNSQLAQRLNQILESSGGFEDEKWAAMVKSVTQGDRHHALKEALTVCFPVVIGVKALESFAPGLMHSVGGALDDLFGAILPDVSQSMGKKGAPFMTRIKEAWPVLKAGVISLPLAMAVGWGSSVLHASSTSVGAHALAGALFALACSAGTLGTSFGAFKKAANTIEKLRTDSLVGGYLNDLGAFGRFRLALQESIFDVPFRVGHTVIGVPLQFALGIAAGVGGFFHNGLFVMAEGMLETLLGAAAAFGLPGLKASRDRRGLKSIEAKGI